MTDELVDRPPLPPLKWVEYFWTGTDSLPSWAGFQARQGPYGAESGGGHPSDGTVQVSVPAPSTPGTRWPWAEQISAYAYLKANEPSVAAAVLRAIFDRYPSEREKYGYEEDEADLMPEIARPDDLKNLMGLGAVHVLSVTKDGTAYLGFEFGCTWDNEHGLGVMTHKDRVVDVGGADTSFLEWIAERDGGRMLDGAE